MREVLIAEAALVTASFWGGVSSRAEGSGRKHEAFWRVESCRRVRSTRQSGLRLQDQVRAGLRCRH
jgi:hypothetical protein